MKTDIGPKTVVASIVVILILSMVACASTRTSKKVNIEKLLTAAGFKKGVADTPEKLAQLKKFPQRKIVSYEESDKIFYIYADVQNCNCAYAGSEEAYKEYQKLSHEKQLIEQDRREAERNQQLQKDWDDSFGRDW